jgi:hypothetical protein
MQLRKYQNLYGRWIVEDKIEQSEYLGKFGMEVEDQWIFLAECFDEAQADAIIADVLANLEFKPEFINVNPQAEVPE